MSALELVFSGDPKLFSIVALSLFVTLSATMAACAVGLPLGALAALARFPGRNALIVFLNGCMGLPPVVVGLFVYLLLSRSGPLGPLGLLFTPRAMIVAQAALIAEYADGVIVGSALCRSLLDATDRQNALASLRRLVEDLAAGVRR